MNDSMYRGKKKFDREQLIFVVECMLGSAMDRLEMQIPPTVSLDDLRIARRTSDDPTGINMIKEVAYECAQLAGHMLSVFYAQLTDDGMESQESLEIVKFERVMEDLLEERLDPDFKGLEVGERYIPDCRKMAEKFVKVVFGEYLPKPRKK